MKRHPVTIEGIAREHQNLRRRIARRLEDARKSGCPIAAMQSCSVIMVHVQVGAVNDHDVWRRRIRHGRRNYLPWPHWQSKAKVWKRKCAHNRRIAPGSLLAGREVISPNVVKYT